METGAAQSRWRRQWPAGQEASGDTAQNKAMGKGALASPFSPLCRLGQLPYRADSGREMQGRVPLLAITDEHLPAFTQRQTLPEVLKTLRQIRRGSWLEETNMRTEMPGAPWGWGKRDG